MTSATGTFGDVYELVTALRREYLAIFESKTLSTKAEKQVVECLAQIQALATSNIDEELFRIRNEAFGDVDSAHAGVCEQALIGFGPLAGDWEDEVAALEGVLSEARLSWVLKHARHTVKSARKRRHDIRADTSFCSEQPISEWLGRFDPPNARVRRSRGNIRKLASGKISQIDALLILIGDCMTDELINEMFCKSYAMACGMELSKKRYKSKQDSKIYKYV